MQIIKDTTDFSLAERPCAVAIGKFDGVHLGHRLIINSVVEQKKRGLRPVVFTFDPDPASVFAGKILPALSVREEKRELLSALGVEVLIEFPMNRQTAAISAERFVSEFLIERMGAAAIYAGNDITFGDKGLGNFALLAEFEAKGGPEAHMIEKLTKNDAVISSSRIKEELIACNVKEAAEMLGKNYSVSGTVVHGRHVGNTIGFPTANIDPAPEKFLPGNGVYLTRVRVGEGEDKKVYGAITNIGRKPTVQNDGRINIESWLKGCDEDLYGKKLTVYFHEFLRPEQRFESLDALRAQLEKDKARII